MKALVAIKRVVDYNIKVRVKPDGSDVEIAGAKMGVNPFDENAIEEAVRLKEKGIVTEIIAVTIGQAAHQDVLRHALAMGADKAVLITAEDTVQPLDVAKSLRALVAREQPQLVLLGKQAIDDDAGQAGQMLAALLDYPQATFASQIDIADGIATVVREVDGGTETIAVPLPAVITTDLRLNEPRFVKLPNLMMARKKEILTLSLAELGVEAKPRLVQLSVAEPPARAPGIMVKDVQELISKLRTHEGVLQ
ncbi:MAG TPA: electron transfer flavoprotein subunit beta/FixA family protein [Methylophilus sp.]